MAGIWHDIRFAWRRTRRQPLLAAAVVLTSGLGIGLTTLMFAVVDTVLLRPLPYSGGDRLVLLRAVAREATPDGEAEAGKVSLPTFDDWRAQSRAFEALAAFESTRPTLTGAGDAELLAGYGVTAGFWRVYGVNAARGRLFDPAASADATAAVISDALWQRRFGRAPDIVGRVVTLDGAARTIVGVLPADHQFFGERRTDLRKGRVPIDVVTPLSTRAWAANRRARWLEVIGRLQPGIPLEQARQDMSIVAARLARTYPGQESPVEVVTMREAAAAAMRSPSLMLLLAAAFVLLIACANVAGLLLARGAARRDDTALEFALGATRWRVVRRMLVESLYLGLAGGGLGVLLAFLGCHVLDVFRLESTVTLPALAVDARVLAFALVIAACTSVAFGLGPALAASARACARVHAGRATIGLRESRFQQVLVALEVALTLVLGVGAGLLVNSYIRLSLVQPGFNPAGVHTASVRLGDAYRTGDRQKAFFADVVAALQATPGVAAAAVTSGVPLAADRSHPRVLRIEGREAGMRELSEQEVLLASGGYFALMSIPLVRGRTFDGRDGAGALPVAIVNESLARIAWGEGDPVGRRISIGGGWMTVVGVIGDVRRRGLAEAPRAEVYLPFQQAERCPRMSLVVRTAGEPSAIWPLVRKAVQRADPGQAIMDAKALERALSDGMAGRNVMTALIALFAGVGLVMASVGLYALIAFAVNRRAREIAIRIAVGGEPGPTSRHVLARVVAVPALGVPLGLFGAWALNGTVSGLLFGVGSLDPVTFAAAAAVVLVVGLAACLGPARRARRLDPIVVLRCE